MRDKPSNDPPQAPYDVSLCRYERRVYRKKSRFSQSTTLNITTQEEAVYYHPIQKCLSQKFGEGNSDNILVSDNVKSQLLDCHRQILLREFGLRVMSKSLLLLLYLWESLRSQEVCSNRLLLKEVALLTNAI